MSQSLGNYIGVEDEPAEMFGKTMSIPDEAMGEWFRLAADFEAVDVAGIEAGLASGDLHPGETKRRLARAVTALYWGDEEAAKAEDAFDRVFKDKGVPEEVEPFALPEADPIQIVALIRDALGVSGAEARRLLAQGAVKVDGEVVSASEASRVDLVGRVMQVGKRRFVRLV
jgi:tyrosyl-tRNA synthetase